jgi:carboxypeptidase family protein/TonB-dependent receptor-like protein
MKTTIWGLSVLLLLAAGPLAAQTTTGSISGTITDESKAVLPGATITVTNTQTGAARTIVADERGRYHAFNLAPGTYDVSAELQGFSPTARKAIEVTIGSDVLVDLAMKVGTISETITVTGEATMLDTRATAIGGLVSTKQIAELPLNGRNFMQLATLQPGVVVSRGTARDFTGGYAGTQLSVGGARPEQTGYFMDGTNIADVSDKAPSSTAGVLLGVDTVQEFSVQTHGYSAEFGRAAGGIISAVTKSGTNTLRGTAFEFHRDSALDSKNFFDVGDPAPFSRNQFGGTAGGPIVKNTLFFFGSYEGLRDRRSLTLSARLPNAGAHQGIIPVNGVPTNVGVAAKVRPYLDLLFPIPDGRDFGDGTAELRHSHTDPTDENFLVAKFDYNLGTKDSMLVRVSSDISDNSNSDNHPLFVEQIGTNTRYFTVQDQHLFSSSTLNVIRFAANRTQRDDDLVTRTAGLIPQSLFFTEDPHWGAINIIGLTQAGSTATIPVDYTQDLYQVTDTFTLSRGTHVWKTGFDYQRYNFKGFSYSRYGGEMRFRNLQEFLTLRRSATAEVDRFTGNLPGTDTRRNISQNYAAFFVQDDWRASEKVTVNVGLRYDFVTVPKDKNNQIAGLLSLDDLESGPQGVTPGTDLFKNPSKKSFAPRLGFAWNPAGNDRTIVRGGYGVFYQPLTVSFYRGTAFRIYPYFAGVDIRATANPLFGPDIQRVLAAGINPSQVQKRSEFIFYDADQPFTQQWHANFQRDLGGGFVAQAGYIGSKGTHLPFYGDPNSVPAEKGADGRTRLIPGAGLRYPSWGRIRTRINAARSIYNGLVLGLNKRFSHNVMFQGSYTYGHSNDTWSGGQIGGSDFDNGAGSATNWWDPEAEYGPSNFDVRHNFVFNAVYQLPFGANLTGAAGVLAKGWHVGGVLQLSTGVPVTPIIGFDRVGDLQSDADSTQKPDQVGSINYPGTSDQWFDPKAFVLPEPGVYGNASRGAIRGPGLKVADLTLFKNIPAGRVTAQFRLEAFNAFNWVNLGLPNAIIFNTNGTYSPVAGRITSTATPARQLQLGLKLIF